MINSPDREAMLRKMDGGAEVEEAQEGETTESEEKEGEEKRPAESPEQERIETAIESQRAQLAREEDRYEKVVTDFEEEFEKAAKEFPELSDQNIMKELKEGGEEALELFGSAKGALDAGKNGLIKNLERLDSEMKEPWLSDIKKRSSDRSLAWYIEWNDISMDSIRRTIDGIADSIKEATVAIKKASAEKAFGGNEGIEERGGTIQEKIKKIWEGNAFTAGGKHLKPALESFIRFARPRGAAANPAAEAETE